MRLPAPLGSAGSTQLSFPSCQHLASYPERIYSSPSKSAMTALIREMDECSPVCCALWVSDKSAPVPGMAIRRREPKEEEGRAALWVNMCASGGDYPPSN